MLSEISRPPRVFILRMRHVPAIDATGMHALAQMAIKCQRQGTTLLVCEVRRHPMEALRRAGKVEKLGGERTFALTVEAALDRAEEIIHGDPTLRVTSRPAS